MGLSTALMMTALTAGRVGVGTGGAVGGWVLRTDVLMASYTRLAGVILYSLAKGNFPFEQPQQRPAPPPPDSFFRECAPPPADLPLIPLHTYVDTTAVETRAWPRCVCCASLTRAPSACPAPRDRHVLSRHASQLTTPSLGTSTRPLLGVTRPSPCLLSSRLACHRPQYRLRAAARAPGQHYRRHPQALGRAAVHAFRSALQPHRRAFGRRPVPPPHPPTSGCTPVPRCSRGGAATAAAAVAYGANVTVNDGKGAIRLTSRVTSTYMSVVTSTYL
eukprot:1913741-Prymnesium_polylepis.1